MGRAELPSLTIGRYTVKKPIGVGGMSVGISTGELAGAVANEGGFGTIGGVGLGFKKEGKGTLLSKNLRGLQDEIRLAKEISPEGVVGINLLRAISQYPRHVKAALEAGVDFIVTGAGLPTDLPDLAKGYPDVALIPIVSSARGARAITRDWMMHRGRIPDAIIIEEPATAGGHLGLSRSQTIVDIYNEDLLLVNAIPETKRWLEQKGLDIPLIAAGGIWDREDIDRMLDLGARGIQMGTRFVCTEESGASEEFMQKYLEAEKGDIVYTVSPVGYPGRVIETDFSRYVNSTARNDEANVQKEEANYHCPAKCLEVCSYRESKGKRDYCIIEALHIARAGDAESGIVFAGSNAHRAKEQGVVPAKQILDELTATD